MRSLAMGASDVFQPFGKPLIDTGFNVKSRGFLAPQSLTGLVRTLWGFLPRGESGIIA
jgi:hypothetical protein